MEKDFQEHLKRLEEEFMAERNLMIKTYAEQKKVCWKLKEMEISEQELCPNWSLDLVRNP